MASYAPVEDPFGTPRPRRVDGRVRDARDLGDSIRTRRKKLELTQQQAADFCGVTQRYISELERGKAGGRINQVLRVCNRLGVKLYVKES